MTTADIVLIVDDQPINIALLSALVRGVEGLEPVGFTDPVEALRWVERNAPVLLLVDFAMPQMDGAEFVSRLRATEHGEIVPIIMVTAHTERDILLRALEAGASDFIRKPIDEVEVVARVRSLSQLGHAARKLKALATTDDLTGLDNRRCFMARLDDEIARARRYGTVLSVVMIDIDHFKRINDSAGHAAGDAVLVEFARRLCRTMRDTDFAGRIGGEEFAWALPASDRHNAATAAERLRMEIAEAAFMDDRNVTASLGVAEFSHDDTAQSFMRKADACLYQAKATGRNRIVTHIE